MKQRIVLFTILILASSGCAALEGGGGGGGLSARVDRHDQQIQQILSQVGQVEQVLPGQAEMWAQVQNMRQEINMINGKIDDMQRGGAGGETAQLRERVNRLEAVVRQMASQLAINVDSLNSPEAGAAAPAQTRPAYAPQAGGAPPAAASGPAGGGTVNTATILYESGIKAFDQRRYKDAVVAFKDFVASYPKHNLAGNAHFWEGESYFQMKDFARAALAYQEVIAGFPGSAKVQSSMLKQGIALHNAGKKPAARERLQDLVKRYPNSPEASRAKQFLAGNP